MASDLGPTDGNRTSDVYLRDLQVTATVTAPAGTELEAAATAWSATLDPADRNLVGVTTRVG